jgi:bifunctional non-homologous end joining protein LigD
LAARTQNGWLPDAGPEGRRWRPRAHSAGSDWTDRYPQIRQAANVLKATSFLIDGEAVCCDENSIPVFEMLRKRRNDPTVILVAFDLVQLNGNDLRKLPIEDRKAALTEILRGAPLGIQYNDHVEADAALVFQHACQMGLEGIVSKRRGSPYQSGRTNHWLKLKNPDSPAMKREAEEDWMR